MSKHTGVGSSTVTALLPRGCGSGSAEEAGNILPVTPLGREVLAVTKLALPEPGITRSSKARV